MPLTIGLDQFKRVLSRLPENPRIVVSGNAATPTSAIDAIDETLEYVTIHMLNAIHPLPRRDGVTLETTFVGPGMRNAPNLCYVPSRLSLVPVLMHHSLRPDAVIVHASTPRKDAVSLGVEVNILPAAIESTRSRGGVVIAMINPRMPFTLGHSLMDLNDIDYLVEVDDPIAVVPVGDADPLSRAIGDQISEYIHSGSTLQLGIGGVPDAVLGAITDARDLRIWSETISDGVLALERAGALDPDVPVRQSFMMGSDELYAWADNNPRVSMLRTEHCNSPALIARNHAMTSVNGALEVDLHGQSNASRVKGHIYSGFGGSTDFIVGALHSSGGRSFMALPSWHPKANASTIVPELDGPATSFQQSAVVTEQGIAWLFGGSEREQAEQLIESAAHPRARESLREALKEMQLN